MKFEKLKTIITRVKQMPTNEGTNISIILLLMDNFSDYYLCFC